MSLNTSISDNNNHKNRQNILFFLAVLMSVLLLLLMAAPLALAAENGQVLFEQNCAGCHTLDGTGKGFAPDLKGVTKNREHDWLVNWIAEPDKMIENGDPIAQKIVAKYNGVPMPNMGLTKEQSAAIVDYLAGNNDQALINSDQNIAQKTDNLNQLNFNNQITENNQNKVAIISNSEERKGKELFIGKIRFENKAPSCNSCHSVGIGALNGGTLGPNLTHVFGRYGEMGLSSVLKTLPYPSMQGIYQDKPLTEAEQTALLAFLKQQDSITNESIQTGSLLSELNPTMILALLKQEDSLGNEPMKTDKFLIELTPTIKFMAIALAGCILLLIISNIVWSDRFTGVRQKMVENK
jgi:putative heme-binding domain-containing protein